MTDGPAGRVLRGLARTVADLAGRAAVRPFIVRGSSMLPGLTDGQWLAVNPLAYLLGGPGRGDVVILDPAVLGGRDRIKRVIGLSGERVRVSEGRVWIDGRELDEPYLSGRPRTSGMEEGEWDVGDGEVFVLGDNRPLSTDSRSHGPVASGRIRGRVWLRFWPPGLASLHAGGGAATPGSR